MADINTGDLVRLIQSFSMPEEVIAQNVLAFRATAGESTDAQLLTAAATFMSTLYTNLVGIMHNQVSTSDCKVVKVVWSGGAWITDRVIGTFLPGVTGTDGTDMLPHAVAGVLTLPTAVPKRRGRVFLPGITEANQANSLWVAGAATAIGNFATTLRTGFTSGTADMRYAVLGNDGLNNTSTSFSVRGISGTQRKRKPGVGI